MIKKEKLIFPALVVFGYPWPTSILHWLKGIFVPFPLHSTCYLCRALWKTLSIPNMTDSKQYITYRMLVDPVPFQANVQTILPVSIMSLFDPTHEVRRGSAV
jgi:hypothetical protein